MTFDQPFDAVVGRYVLQFIPDPSAAVARLSDHLRGGGVMVFHELDWEGARSRSPITGFRPRRISVDLARGYRAPGSRRQQDHRGQKHRFPACMELEPLQLLIKVDHRDVRLDEVAKNLT
jgi:hypothetical protein